MQLKITFQCSELLLPVACRQQVQAMLYRQLQLQPEYASWLHDIGKTYENRTFKHFTFGQLQGSYTFLRAEKQLLFHDSIQLEVRSVDPQFIQLLLQSLQKGRKAELNHQTVEVTSVRLENNQIAAPEILIQTLTPIAAHITREDHYQRWFGPEDPEFYQMVTHNAERRYRSLYPDAENETLRVQPVEPQHYTKTVTTYKGVIINAWNGVFRLSGSPRMLNFLYDCGLGERNAQGFGMFRVLPETEHSGQAER